MAATLCLALYGAYLALAFGLRTAIQLRRTGSTGFHGLGGRPGSAATGAGRSADGQERGDPGTSTAPGIAESSAGMTAPDLEAAR